MATTTNELDLVIKYAEEKGGATDGQLVIDDVELNRARDNRTRHGIGNEDPQRIEKGNKTYTFSTTAFMGDASVRALKRLERGDAEQKDVYVMSTDDDENTQWKETASGMVWNDLTESSSDGGDTTVSIDADLLGLDLSGTAVEDV